MNPTLTKENKKKLLDTLEEIGIIEGKESSVLTINISEGGLRYIEKDTKITFK